MLQRLPKKDKVFESITVQIFDDFFRVKAVLTNKEAKGKMEKKTNK